MKLFLYVDVGVLFTDFISDSAKDFEYDSNQNIELYEDNHDPKGDEKAPYPSAAARALDLDKHVHSDEPVIYHHLVEQSYQWCTIVIEIEQVPESRKTRVGLIRLCSELAAKEKGAKLRIEVKDQVYEQELA